MLGQGGGQALEEVLAGPPHDGLLAHGVRLGGVPRAVRPVPRYGPPPSSLPLPVFASGLSWPSTSRHARSLLEGRLVDRPNLDSQALQLALGELGQAMRRAEVRLLPCLFVSIFTPILVSIQVGFPLLRWSMCLQRGVEKRRKDAVRSFPKFWIKITHMPFTGVCSFPSAELWRGSGGPRGDGRWRRRPASAAEDSTSVVAGLS